MKLNLKGVEFSKRDIEKGIIIPTELTAELAEDIGIHIGDGCMYKCNKDKTCYEFCYSSNNNEKEYFEYIINLKKKLYNLKKFRARRIGNELRLNFNSKVISLFYNKVFGFPFGSKCKTVGVPKIIKNCKNKDIIASCIRGIVDTDFYFRYIRSGNYPVLRGRFASPFLIKDLSKLFSLLGIKNSIKFNELNKRYDKTYLINTITINWRENLSKYLKLIGFNNPKNSRKIKYEPDEI